MGWWVLLIRLSNLQNRRKRRDRDNSKPFYKRRPTQLNNVTLEMAKLVPKEEAMISSKKERKKRPSTKLTMETGGTEERDNPKPSYKRRPTQLNNDILGRAKTIYQM